MKDLDFDELDRAVASALNTSTPMASPVNESSPEPTSAVAEPAGSPSSDEVDGMSSSISSHAVHSRLMPSAVPTTRTTLARKPAEPVSAEPVEASSAPDSTPAAPVSALPALRRTIPHREGRFMDVMRSSSPQPSRPIQQAPAQGESSMAPEASPEPEIAPSGPINTHLEAAIDELLAGEGRASPTAADEPQSTETPTTIDLSLNSVAVTPAVSDEESLESIAADLGKSTEPTPEVAPSGSPFLADAKVEKRPLGVADELITAGDIDPTLAPEPTMAAPETENTPVPEELQSDLMAIESGAASDATSTSDTESKPVGTGSQVSAATGPTSIARQYKEQPRTASEDDESGAIFDPQTYQQPIEHPAKKSSGWGWVIGIVVIILLAVAAAVAAWFGGILPVQL